MFQIFLKKQQYGKVSSKFKHHFQQRLDRVNFVKSQDTKIEEKMQIFKELINDGAKVQKKSTIIKASYIRQNKRQKANQLYDREISELGQMTDGFIEWNNARMQKNKQKENIFSWGNYKEEKQARKQSHESNLGEVLKQRLDLKQLRLTHRSQKFQTQIGARIENKILEKERRIPFHLSCRQSPEKNTYIVEMFEEKNRKKYELAKYFGQMKEFSCHEKLNAEPSSAGLKPLKGLQKSLSSTAYCTPLKYRRSGSLTPCEIMSRVKGASENQADTFRDDKIYSDIKARFSQVQEPTCSVPKEEMCILTKQGKVQMICKNYKKLKKLPLSTVKSLRLITGLQLGKNVFRTTAHCPFNINKLNAVKKVQCL